jgi:hypothetical protein
MLRLGTQEAMEGAIMIRIDVNDDDAPEFIAAINVIAQRIAILHAPAEFIIVKIDNWFDHKWLNFSGKILGAVGTWNQELTVPPFVPNRVVWERYFSLSSNTERKDRPALHVSTPASDAVRRKVSNVAPDAAIVWFSGKSETNERGAIMSYVPTLEGHWAWYAGWSNGDSWSTTALKGISAAELSVLSNPAAL